MTEAEIVAFIRQATPEHPLLAGAMCLVMAAEALGEEAELELRVLLQGVVARWKPRTVSQ